MTAPRKMDCNDVVKQIWDWLDQELDAAAWRDIEAHLEGCSGCAEHVEFAQGFLKQVHATPTPAGDIDALRERVRAALKA